MENIKKKMRSFFWRHSPKNKPMIPKGTVDTSKLNNQTEVFLTQLKEYLESDPNAFRKFVESEEKAREIYTNVGGLFSERGLKFNEDKTSILSPGEPFELLGFRINGDEFDISKTALETIIWKLNHRARKLVRLQSKYGLSKEEAMQKMINRITMYFFWKRYG